MFALKLRIPWADLSVIAALLLIAGFIVAPSASAETDADRNLSVAYADTYTCNVAGCNNPKYKYIANDCVNFVSQAVEHTTWGTAFHNVLSNNWGPYTLPWVNVAYFADKFVSRYTVYTTTLTSAYTPAQKGDVYVYDWGRGSGWSHMSLEAGWGARSTYYNDGVGDFIDQHTNDRWHAAWNYGYLHPDSTIDRTKMRVDIMDWK